MTEIKKQVELCIECGVCNDVCPTFEVTGNELFGPQKRVAIAKKVFSGEKISDEEIESIYSCPKCMLCENICAQELDIVEIIHKTRETLVKNKIGPLENHHKVMNGIIKNENSVGGDPQKRMNWLEDENLKQKYLNSDSDTLLYLGCIPSYLAKDSSYATLQVLDKLGYDFRVIEDEGCCGTYFYECGNTEFAREYFEKNLEKFKSLGIKKLVVPCNGCLKCFKYFYPAMLGDTGLEIEHAVETIFNLLEDKKDILKKVEREVTFQDPCRLARMENMTKEPRDILKACGANLKEMEKFGKDASCCGAGAGIRSVYPELSLKLAEKLLKSSKTEQIATACPFCTFNLSYASKKKSLDKDLIYFSKIVLDSL
ncbi:MAG: (Fe-S)-binding protein [Desulforegulaceae bacterium]|nr:(Fe-S)-binding protein [Desulforegulaceae bacterium]